MTDLTDVTRTVRTKIHLCGCGCWVWTGSVDGSGYPKMKMRSRMVKVHRYMCDRFVAPLPDDMTVDHLCDRHRNCVNPAHMEIVSGSENSRRANARRWHGGEVDRSLCTDAKVSQPQQPQGETS